MVLASQKALCLDSPDFTLAYSGGVRCIQSILAYVIHATLEHWILMVQQQVFLWVVVLVWDLPTWSKPGCTCCPQMSAAAKASPVRGVGIFRAWYIFPATGCSLQRLLEFLQIPWSKAVAAPLHREDGGLAWLLNCCGRGPIFFFQRKWLVSVDNGFEIPKVN